MYHTDADWEEILNNSYSYKALVKRPDQVDKKLQREADLVEKWNADLQEYSKWKMLSTKQLVEETEYIHRDLPQYNCCIMTYPKRYTDNYKDVDKTPSRMSSKKNSRDILDGEVIDFPVSIHRMRPISTLKETKESKGPLKYEFNFLKAPPDIPAESSLHKDRSTGSSARRSRSPHKLPSRSSTPHRIKDKNELNLLVNKICQLQEASEPNKKMTTAFTTTLKIITPAFSAKDCK